MLLEDDEEEIAKLKLINLAKNNYAPDDKVEDLKTSYEEQMTRIKNYDVYAGEVVRLKALNNNIDNGIEI